MANLEIPPERKLLYYLGLGLVILGVLVFGSVFFTSIFAMGNIGQFDRLFQSVGLRAFAGIAMIVVGRVLMSLGVRGAAGAGLILDPRQARRDVEPWSRMAGGVIKDALDETGLSKGSSSEPGRVSFDEKLRKLHQLYQDGIITEQEYRAKKEQILAEED